MCCGPRLQPVRQRPDRLAQRRAARQQPVERAVARAADRYPDQPVRAGGHVVREAGQVVHEHRVRAVDDRPPPQPVRRGLRHHDERSVRGRARPRWRTAARPATSSVSAPSPRRSSRPVAGVLQQLALPVVDPDAAGRVAEVDRPVRRHRRVVAERQPVDERLHQPGLDRDPQQPAPGVADQQAARPAATPARAAGRRCRRAPRPAARPGSAAAAARRRPRTAPGRRRRTARPRARARARRARSAAAPPARCGAAGPGPARRGAARRRG